VLGYADDTNLSWSDTLTVDLTSAQTIKMVGTVSNATAALTQNNMLIELL
jgi:hypothetical protein